MVFLLLACTATEAPAEDVETEPSIPPTYEVSDYATDDRQAATFDADLVEAGLQAAIDAALTAPADPVLTGYQAAMAYAEDSCPYTYEVDDNLFWYDSCTTSDGATFSGYGTLSAYEDIDLLGDGTPMDGLVVYGEGRIVAPNGDVFETGGTAGALEGTNDDGVTLFVNVTQGAFAWDSDDAKDTWLATDLSPSLTIYAAVIADYNVHYVTIDGGLTGIPGSDGDDNPTPTASFSGIQYADEVVGFPCDEEPAGTISLRDNQGTWYDLRFDIEDTGEMTGDCDGCGTVSLNGEDVGEVCADFSPWLNWGDRPW